MQNLRMIGALAAAGALCSTAAFAGAPAPFRAQATLASPAAATKEVAISGAAWRCEGASCTGTAERRSSIESQLRECRKVTAVLGPVTAYESRGKALSSGELALCNKAAPVETAQSPAPSGN